MASLVASGRAREAAAELILINECRVRGYLRTVLRDPDDADDAFSTFAEWTWRGIEGFRNEGTLEAWVFGVARNAARRVRDSRRRFCRLEDQDLSHLALQRDHLEDDLEIASVRLEALVRTLPSRDRTLLGLRVERRLCWRDIAAVLERQGSRVSSCALRKRFERLKGRMGRGVREPERVG